MPTIDSGQASRPSPRRKPGLDRIDAEINIGLHVTLDVPFVFGILDYLNGRVVAPYIAQLEAKEEELAVANADIKKIRKAIDRMKSDEEKEDADAATYRQEKEAKIAELQTKIVELEAMPHLDTEDQAELAALREGLETLSPPPAEPPVEPPVVPPAPPDGEPISTSEG